MLKRMRHRLRIAAALAITLALVWMCYALFLHLHIIQFLPSDHKLLQCDASWFSSIREDGYVFLRDHQSNMAFFPLFPYLWKLSGAGAIGISIINLTLFVISFIYLFGQKKYPLVYLLALASMPCFLFAFLPYSEAVFFCFGTALIYGYSNNNKLCIAIGLMGCCLTRSVSTFFIPAVILTEIAAYFFEHANKRKAISAAIFNVMCCLAAILLVVAIQGVQTGKWFYYIEVQKYWHRHWLLPALPLTTVSPNKVLGIDTVAFALGLIAILFCTKWSLSTLRSRPAGADSGQDRVLPGRAVIFSALFISAIVIVDTCFTYNIDGKTNIQCMNRHLLCTPFALWFLNWLHQDLRHTVVSNTMVIAGMVIATIITAMLKYPHHLIYFTLFGLAYHYRGRYSTWPMLGLFSYNIFLLVILYHDFLNGRWVG